MGYTKTPKPSLSSRRLERWTHLSLVNERSTDITRRPYTVAGKQVSKLFPRGRYPKVLAPTAIVCNIWKNTLTLDLHTMT